MIDFLDHPSYNNKSINKVAASQVYNTIQGNENIKTQNKRDANVRGSPNPWVTPTKLSCYVIFNINNRLQPQQICFFTSYKRGYKKCIAQSHLDL